MKQREDDEDLRVPDRKVPRGPASYRNDNASHKSRKNTVPAIDFDAATQDEVEEAMRRAMGFSSFRSTKETKIPGNNLLYASRREKTTKYRQYMNRKGGFNRPLSPS